MPACTVRLRPTTSTAPVFAVPRPAGFVSGLARPRMTKPEQNAGQVGVVVPVGDVPPSQIQALTCAVAHVLARQVPTSLVGEMSRMGRTGDVAPMDGRNAHAPASAAGHAIDAFRRTRMARLVRRKVLVTPLRAQTALLGDEGPKRAQSLPRPAHRSARAP